MSLSENFLNSENLNKVLNDVNNLVFQKTNINLNNFENTKSKFQKMAKVIHSKFNNPDITLTELNTKLNINASNFFIDFINKKKQNKLNNVGKTENIKSGSPSLDNKLLIPDDNKQYYYGNKSQSNNSGNKLNNSKYIINENIPEIIGHDLPLFDNINDNTSDNLDSRVSNYLENRNKLMSNNDSINNNNSMSNNLKNKLNTEEPYDPQDINNVELINIESDLQNRKNMSSEYIKEINNLIENKFHDLTKRIENTLIKPDINEDLYQKIISLQREQQPNFYIKSNYVLISSADRDWYNEPTSLNRYNFKVKFGNLANSTSATINSEYKNVTSIELVNCFIPKDNVLIPFDARPYIDILTYPYLVLKIPEITNVFRATNSSSDSAFSILIYDKKHDSSVLSTDYISGTNSIVNSDVKKQFYCEYIKTYYKYIPAYFEKKEYYNQPLGSLTNMTIQLENPNNENINAMPDVLKIETIQFTDEISNLTAADFEYDLSNSYPNDANASTRQYIRIQTTTSFSSKLFRIGDNIRLQGISADVGASNTEINLVNYLNRNEGHYILNFDISDFDAEKNQGYTSNIYISTPGEIEFEGNAGLIPSTYIDSNNASFDNITSSNGKLLNRNLQTHYLFKINTRTVDVASINKPINI